MHLKHMVLAPADRRCEPLRRHHTAIVVLAVVMVGAQNVADFMRDDQSIELWLVRMQARHEVDAPHVSA